ncbi:hypothetical protein HRI_005104600 [Hibiscus trionum]|uniref:Tyrosinase copper-binding domain-containing protein n=1 Tax=Hibiscus trionum TaxID=183268 RepID=A0A9W7JLJ4_HIBTR|nr:hypothetical protein HRI_005104600 [Hibiscus trionum]
MASTLPPSATFITSSFHPKTSQLSIAGKRKPRFISKPVSCKATNGDHQNKFDRRDVLLGLGGLYGVAASLNEPLASATPMDFVECGQAELPPGVPQFNTCPSPKIVDFVLPSPSDPLRTRPAAHLVDDDYLDKFSKAIERMKCLPADDPRSFMQQANVHCAYCNGTYHQVGFPDLEIEVHSSWLFFPFHRLYIYFFERILGKLIGDPSFAMPFWNWDAPAGMQMPAIYTNPNSPLYDKFRNACHQPPTIVDLNYGKHGSSSTSREDQISKNLILMNTQMNTNGKLFLGEAYRKCDKPSPGAGSLERLPHNTIHNWCGDNTQPNGEDMGDFYSAARDPIFYAHHSNVDRMWSVWKTLGGKRRDFTDPDWLNTTFLFYDENADLVRAKVGDCLDTMKLRYDYQPVDIPWKKTKSTPLRARGVENGAEPKKKALGNVVFPLVLDDINIEFIGDRAVKFDVYVNHEDDTLIGPEYTEFAGSFVNVPHSHKHGNKAMTSMRLGLTDLLEELDAEGDDAVVVTLVPQDGKGLAKIGGINIEFVRT